MIYSNNNGTIPINEGILGLTKEEKEGLNKIKNGVKSIFTKKKKTNKPLSNKAPKLTPLENSEFEKYRNNLLKELKNICKSYNNKYIYPEIFEDDGMYIIIEIFHIDQEYNLKNIDTLYEIADKLENTAIYKDINNNAVISIDFGDGDEGCLYITIYKNSKIKESCIFKYADLE